MDADAALHRRTYRQVLADAGLDDELAATLYAVESDLSLNAFADDVAGTLAALRRRGVRVGVLSDLHVDVRPAFRAVGLGMTVLLVPPLRSVAERRLHRVLALCGAEYGTRR
ncbi:protein of unknown function [Modestobacter italicus]|uniref:Uncharacterized protein n=1 Tax=Modestobacter italicus (strain DSM 44449 / CECT 9708 / BC 501) TaxID=2732864 RepID=I4F510_MODI5|nr:hypothetical protein [Modestobacter marinus]CCH90723.1 protein of unknown function [Modestobacter marinus]